MATVRPGFLVAAFVVGLAVPVAKTSASMGAEEFSRALCEDCGVECSCVSFPRWVLRDADGERVRALAEPRCGQYDSTIEAYNRCPPLEFGSPDQFACARIIDADGKYINLNYDLQSGSLAPCMQGPDDPGQSIDDLGSIRYADENCAGPPFRRAHFSSFVEPQFQRSQEIRWAAGDIWYHSGEGCLEPGSDMFGKAGGCIATIISERYCPLLPVPGWVRDLLPNPPYTLTLEYN